MMNLITKTPFAKTPLAIMSATKIKNNVKNIEVELDIYESWLYCWMLNEYLHLKSVGKQMFHNIDDIALNVKMSSAKVMKCMKKLEEVGLMVKYQKKIRGAQMSNSYEMVYDLSVFTLIFPEGMRKDKVEFLLSDVSKKESVGSFGFPEENPPF